MRIGIIGADQLGRMLALSSVPPGLQFTMYDRSHGVPSAAVAPIVTGAFSARLWQIAAAGPQARSSDPGLRHAPAARPCRGETAAPGGPLIGARLAPIC